VPKNSTRGDEIGGEGVYWIEVVSARIEPAEKLIEGTGWV